MLPGMPVACLLGDLQAAALLNHPCLPAPPLNTLTQGTKAAVEVAKAKADLADRGKRLQAECSKVVSLFRQQLLGLNVNVKRVERVQNWRLWTKYTIRRR